jgi:hypothetical protein
MEMLHLILLFSSLSGAAAAGALDQKCTSARLIAMSTLSLSLSLLKAMLPLIALEIKEKPRRVPLASPIQRKTKTNR